MEGVKTKGKRVAMTAGIAATAVFLLTVFAFRDEIRWWWWRWS